MSNIKEIISVAHGLVDKLTGIVAAVALLIFFWGMVKFISKAGDEKSVTDGKNLMKWGIIVMFVMFSIWGIITYFQVELGLRPPTNIIDPLNPRPPEDPLFPRNPDISV